MVLMETIKKDIINIMSIYNTFCIAESMEMLFNDISRGEDLFTGIQIFAGIAWRKNYPWLCYDICYYYYLWIGETEKSAFLKPGRNYWAYKGFYDEISDQRPSDKDYWNVFKEFNKAEKL
jgi:hypothetical protein